MALRAEYEIGCTALPLVDVAAAVPDADIDLAISPGMNERPRFTVRVVGSDETVAAVEVEFERTPFVGEYTLVTREGEASRYTILPGTSMAEQLGDDLDDLDDLRALYETPTHIERIRATPTGWVQTSRFADRGAFDELREFWQRNVPFRLRKLTRVGDDAENRFGSGPDSDNDDGLTDAQREAVRTAHRLGYFEIPRTATLDDVAAELDISASSLSERLRRAQTHLVEAHVEERPRPVDPF
ncbi:helix-turn-helix domain-containing protein [Halosimplex litoreum]|uniref:Helix-turn-helix domain-containing protein n=1 Tax=Halosimplex litoreum TaxID=1198301 RepID=A0A7T3FVK1_9EURY|nr:helix-turn-helix domain-containing protein [Halosimplex litoreum]QPV61534.1 helix-turn-helix domain-containing protein [Halosimplex litoreum]